MAAYPETVFEKSRALRDEYAANGAVKIPGLLSPEVLGACRECFDETLHRPVKKGVQVKYPDGSHYNPASGHRAPLPMIFDLIDKGPFKKMLSELWGSKSVWFFDHEIWEKRSDGSEGRSLTRSDTPFHQDSRVVPFYGPHTAIIWMSFEPLKAPNCLQVVKGSHVGPLYELPSKGKSLSMGGVTVKEFPMLPQTEEERAGWEYCAWDLNPGDAVVFNAGAVHGGASVGPELPFRNTLVLRFFGDECFFTSGLGMWSEFKIYKNMRDGDHFSKCLPENFLLDGPGLPGIQGQGRPKGEAAGETSVSSTSSSYFTPWTRTGLSKDAGGSSKL